LFHAYGPSPRDHAKPARARDGDPATLAVERRAAEFFDCQAAFYSVSGYVGKQILVQALAGQFDLVLADESAHHAVEEAARLAARPVVRFPHGDPDGLQRLLRQRLLPGDRPLVMTDGVFAATGDIAPLDEHVRVLGQCPQACLMVDDAHGVATLGEHGRGTLEHLGLWGPDVNAQTAAGVRLYACGALSKAVGSSLASRHSAGDSRKTPGGCATGCGNWESGWTIRRRPSWG
jgi:7-keto-8-aminopelargonate synthetase-like enzyme